MLISRVCGLKASRFQSSARLVGYSGEGGKNCLGSMLPLGMSFGEGFGMLPLPQCGEGSGGRVSHTKRGQKQCTKRTRTMVGSIQHGATASWLCEALRQMHLESWS